MYPVPLTFTPPMAPAGAPCIKISWNLFRGNMIIGGRKLPAAFMQQSAVVFFPRSADDALRTCLTPFVATTFPGCTTVLIPVSSQFQMLVALKLPFWRVSSNTSKNPFTAFSVKPLMRARLVAMGFLMVNAPLRCMNPRSQSFPAILVLWSNLCLTCCLSASSYANRRTSMVVMAYILLSINCISRANCCSMSLGNTVSTGPSFRVPGLWTARSRWRRIVLLGIPYCRDAWAIFIPFLTAWRAFWRESSPYEPLVDLRLYLRTIWNDNEDGITIVGAKLKMYTNAWLFVQFEFILDVSLGRNLMG